MLPVRMTRFAPACVIAALAAAPAQVLAAVDLPGGGKLETVDFERHVMGLFGKTGCNNGSCHGSFQGKNGFRLSLFGYDPDKDYAALTREILGRRINPVNPDESLLLLKATGIARHDGGMRFGKDSWQYQVFRQWIAQGAGHRKGSGAVVSVSITPAEYAYCKPGQTVQVVAKAKFADGSEEVITPFCDFRISDDSIAAVSPLGQVTAAKPGDAGLVVSYRGNVVAARVLVPAPAAEGFVYPKLPEVNYIDREVFAKLRRLNMVPSDLAGDEEFLRRLYIDVTGGLPSPDEVRAFLADRGPNKRERKIDELLTHPRHAALWATKFSDITGNNTDALEQPVQLRPRRSQMWHDWFRKRLAENRPYDEIVRGVLTATSREGLTPKDWLEHAKKLDDAMAKGFDSAYADRQTLDLFWRRQQQVPIEQWGEKVAAAFLGVRLECAQCHKHPTDRWTQADYRSFANLFAQVSFANNAFSDPGLKKLIDAENAERRKSGKKNNQLVLVREMFLLPTPRTQVLMSHPETGVRLTPKALGGPEIPFEKGVDSREALFKWMVQPDNPFFARSFVNRVWAHYFGVGLVDPVDDFSLANPPTNARLLDALAKDFVAHKYDIRHLERTILLSRTYQLASRPNETNKFDKNNYAHAYVRPMMAEVVVDVLNDALGVSENFGQDVPAGKRMVEIGASRLQNPSLSYALRIFGRPPRTTACDCERAMDPALPQTLYRMTDPNVLGKLRAPNNRIATLLKAKKPDDAIFEELVLATLGRMPKPEERAAFREHVAQEKDRNAAFVDVLWALINTREFILNH